MVFFGYHFSKLKIKKTENNTQRMKLTLPETGSINEVRSNYLGLSCDTSKKKERKKTLIFVKSIVLLLCPESKSLRK